MKQQIIDDIFAHAKHEYPRESCGLVVMRGRKQRYIRCTNTADSADDCFVIPAAEYAAAEDLGEIIRIVHSHCGDGATTQPSAADIAGCNESGIRWLIVSLPEGDLREIEPDNPPLVGRPFVLGSYDCWGLIMAWHREHGVELRDWRVNYPWWERGENRYMDNWHSEGFREVSTPAPGDMVMMQVSADVVNHAGILLPGNELLHHVYGELSASVPYSGYWRERTIKIVRHRDLNYEPV